MDQTNNKHFNQPSGIQSMSVLEQIVAILMQGPDGVVSACHSVSERLLFSYIPQFLIITLSFIDNDHKILITSSVIVFC